MGATVNAEVRTPERWMAKCLKKTSYPTEIAARKAGFATLNYHRCRGLFLGPPALYVYACDICGGFHLTRKPSGTAPITREGPIGKVRG